MRGIKVIIVAATAMMIMAVLSAPAMAQSSTPCYGFCDNAPADTPCYGFCGNAAPDATCYGFCGPYPTTQEPAPAPVCNDWEPVWWWNPDTGRWEIWGWECVD